MSIVTYKLHQATSIEAGPLYQVKNEVLEAVGSSAAVFVYKTDTKAFSHYATVADLEEWPDSYESAVQGSKDFYRQPSVTRGWKTIEEMNKDLAVTLARVRGLAQELGAVQGSVTIDRTITISGGA